MQTVSFAEHDSIRITMLAHFFPLGLNQIYTSTLTPGLRYRPFLVNGPYYINKNSFCHIKKTTFAQLFHIQLAIFSPLFLHITYKVMIPRCQEGRELDDLTQFVPWTSFRPDLIHSLPTFWLNDMSSIHNSVCCLKILKLFTRQTSGTSLRFQ